MEAVSFTYKKIKMTWEPNGIEAEDSWIAPR
jgi:type VI secretion system secreted protein Hcp